MFLNLTCYAYILGPRLPLVVFSGTMTTLPTVSSILLLCLTLGRVDDRAGQISALVMRHDDEIAEVRDHESAVNNFIASSGKLSEDLQQDIRARPRPPCCVWLPGALVLGLLPKRIGFPRLTGHAGGGARPGGGGPPNRSILPAQPGAVWQWDHE